MADKSRSLNAAKQARWRAKHVGCADSDRVRLNLVLDRKTAEALTEIANTRLLGQDGMDGFPGHNGDGNVTAAVIWLTRRVHFEMRAQDRKEKARSAREARAEKAREEKARREQTRREQEARAEQARREQEARAEQARRAQEARAEQARRERFKSSYAYFRESEKGPPTATERKIAALRAKTVSNGCTPEEARSAQALADRLAKEHGVNA
jgi:uncharacterized membrane protein YqiK